MRATFASYQCGSPVWTPESPYLLAAPPSSRQDATTALRRKTLLENLYCLRCNREFESGDKSVAVYMFAQTVGVKPRQKSAAQRISFCPQCSVSLAMGPSPEGALNIAAWNMIRDLVGSGTGLNQAAWETLRGMMGLLPSGREDDVPRRTGTGGYFEF